MICSTQRRKIDSIDDEPLSDVSGLEFRRVCVIPSPIRTQLTFGNLWRIYDGKILNYHT